MGRFKKARLLSFLFSLLFDAGAAASDCNRNGIEDAAEVSSGFAEDCNRNLIPDECDVEQRFNLRAPISFSAEGQKPTVMTAADLDGDKDLDLAVAYEVTEFVMVFLNDGTGGFPVRTPYPAGGRANSIVAADFNGDGHLDLLLSTYGKSWLLRNQGDGTFSNPTGNEISGSFFVTAADLDGDQDLDLALSSGNTLLNNGNGIFTQDPSGQFRFSSDAGEASFLTAMDLDGDGDMDLAAMKGNSSNISIFLNRGKFQNRGDGRFRDPVFFDDGGKKPLSAVGVDLDRDGDLDLAVANSSSEDVSVLLNKGDGSFGEPALIPTEGITPVWVVAGDIDADGDLDLLTSNADTDNLSLLRNLGGGRFDRAQLLSTGTTPQCTVAGDLDCDGDLDLATANLTSSTVTLLLNLGQGDFPGGERAEFPMKAFVNIVTGTDLEGDADLDLVAVTRFGILTLFNDGRREFRKGETVRLSVDPFTLKAGDLDGDGDADLVVAVPFNVAFLLGNGDGSFDQPEEFKIPSNPTDIAVGDLDRDGDLDVAASTIVFNNPISDSVSILLNDGKGRFEPARNYAAGLGPMSLSLGDLDGDGDLDLSVLPSPGFSSSVSLLENDGAARFLHLRSLPFSIQQFSLAAGDIDGDQDLDLVVAGENVISVFSNQGQMSFAAKNQPGPGGTFAVLQDLDGNGSPDLIFGRTISIGDVSIRLNKGNGTFFEPVIFSAGLWISKPFAADFDGDGATDLAVDSKTSISILFNEPIPPRSPDLNQDGIPDACESLRFHRGDPSGDGAVNITDAVSILGFLFLGGGAPACVESGDVDNNGDLNLTDAISLLRFLFQGGPPPAPPGPPPAPCAEDPADPPAHLDCGPYAGC